MFYFPQLVKYAHPGTRAINIDNSDEDWSLEASRVRPYVGDGESIDSSSVLDLDPFVCRTVALFAVHSRGNKNSLALEAFPSNYLPLLQLREKSADRYTRGPTVLGFKLVDNVKILALPHFVQCDFAALIACYLPRHSFSPLGPHHSDRADLHQIPPRLGETGPYIFLHLSLSGFSPELPEDLTDLHHASRRYRITNT